VVDVAVDEEFGAEDDEESAPEQTDDRAWIALAEQSYRTSTDYMDANLRRTWEHNVSNLMGQHPRGSKYYGDSYRQRSRLFRPKTRAAERSFEAALAVAFFSNKDVASVEAEDAGDDVAQASAQINHYLLNHHLTKNVPWFKIVMGAAQDAWTYGIAWTETGWTTKEVRGVRVKDQPFARVRPVENIRIDPSCDWLDPVNTSPYLIDVMPMYISDVLARVDAGEWRKVTVGDLQSARRMDDEDDSTRLAREGRDRQDRMSADREVRVFDVIWVHKNIITVGGEDYLFFTAGTDVMLSDPVPLLDVHPDGRPYVLGNVVLDTHRVNPSSVAGLSKDLQSQANSIVNQRTDNVELGMNTRFLVDRASETDREALKVSRPGGTIYTSDINGVKELKSSDVTRSSYEEQDRLNVDFDEIAGVFSQSSVASNRRMNETVGGMDLLSQGSSVMTEYQIRVFTETWYEPVVRQLVRLIQRYETDEKRLAVAARTAQIYQKFGVDKVTDALLQQDISSSISVGFNATNPEKRIQHLMLAVNSVAALLKPGELRVEELAKEVFGAAGYKDGLRFTNFPKEGEEPPPQPPSSEQIKYEGEMKLLEMKLADAEAERQAKYQLVEQEQKVKTMLAEKHTEVELIKLATQNGWTVAKLQNELQLNREKIQSHERGVAIDIAMKKQEGVDPGKVLGG
jgi:hypothetical protein